MEECNDNRNTVSTDCKTIPSPKFKPKKRSLVERELETSLTSRITSPISISETINTSRYGRARRLKNDVLMTTDKKTDLPSLIPNREKSPSRGLCAYKMYASNSPSKPQSIKQGLDNQIENIYNQNIALSRFRSDEKREKLSKSKIYMRKDLIQTRDKEETIILIKNMFSPNKNGHQAAVTLSSEKSSKNHKRDLSSVVKTLDFDGKKKREGQEKRMSQSDLFELEAQCEYQVGDLAWARMGSYPFWPSIVTREPSSNLFLKKKLFGKLEKDMIHVTFFGDNGRRGWILVSMLRKYLGLQEFETARENFTSEAKRKDYRLYAAFFVTGKRLPLWHLSVEEAEILFKEPKRLRIDIFNSMLTKGKEHKSVPAKSKKVTRKDSDISLSESLYDSLFSEDDYKGSDTESSRNKTRKKSFDVSEVVTACLDNMAAKTGITKIQKQSHMDIWLQKAKSKTPEKCQFKHLKSEKKVKVISKSCNESDSSMEYKQTHEKEHDYFTRSVHVNGYSNDEMVDSGTDNNPKNIYTSNLSNSESDGANESCKNICEKDVLGISPDIADENFTEIEVITNEDIILDGCDINNLIFKVDQRNILEEFKNNIEPSQVNKITNVSQTNFNHELNSIDTINEKKDVKECFLKRVENHNICTHQKSSLEVKHGVTMSDNCLSNKDNLEMISNNVEYNVSRITDFNQEKSNPSMLCQKTSVVVKESQSNYNLPGLHNNDMKSYSITLGSANEVHDNIEIQDNKEKSNLLFLDKEISTNEEMSTKKKEVCMEESVEYKDIQEKQCKYTTTEQYTHYENKEINQSTEINIVTEISNQSESLKLFSGDSCDMRLNHDSSSATDCITTTVDNSSTSNKSTNQNQITNLNFCYDDNKNEKITISTSSNIQKVCADIPLSSEQDNEKMSKQDQNCSGQHDNKTLQDQDSCDFKLTYDLNNEYDSDSVNVLDLKPSTSEKNNLGCQTTEKVLPVAAQEYNERQNNKSGNNYKDTINVKDTKDHFSCQDNVLENSEFLKYVEQKQDIIMDENPDLTYEEVTTYLLKTWHYERNLKSDKNVSNIIPIATTDNDHHSLESKKKKGKGKTDKCLKTLDFKKSQNNSKDDLLNKSKTDAENSNLHYKLLEKNSTKKDDNRDSLRQRKNNFMENLPLNNFINEINDKSPDREENTNTNRIFGQQIIKTKKDTRANSNNPITESTKNTEFNVDGNHVLEPSTPKTCSDLTLASVSEVSSNTKKVPKLIVRHHKKCIKQEMDSKNQTSNQQSFTISTLNSDENVDCKTPQPEDISKDMESKKMIVENDFLPQSSGIATMSNDDTETSLVQSENNYIAHSEAIESKEDQNENKISKNRFSLRLKRNIVTSDIDSDSAKNQTIGDFNKIVINKENSKKPEESLMETSDNIPDLSYSCESNSSVILSPCTDIQDVNSDNILNKEIQSNTPPSGLSRKKQSKIDDFIKRTKDLNSSFNSGSDKDCDSNCRNISQTVSQSSCNRNDLGSCTQNIEENTHSKRQVRKEASSIKGMDLQNPEFLKYLELRLDQLIDEHPELTLEEITTYIYNTWFFEESIKSENKRTDDLDQRSLVKGLSQDSVGVKKLRKNVDKEKDFTNKIEVPVKEKSKRRAERQFYREDFSDFEDDDLDIYQMYNSTSEREIKTEQDTSKNNINTTKEVMLQHLQTSYDDTTVEEDMAENVDQVEEYFRKLTEPKPNLFKGLVREKVCDVCEKSGDLIKCKGCHSFFHTNCSRKGVEIKESPNPVRGRKKKRKNRGRKPKCLDDSFEEHSDKSQEHDMSFDHETESHTIANADEFEEKLSVKLREMIENPDLKYDTNSSEEELDWSDAEIGACKIVEIIPKKKKPESIDFKCADCEENSIPICFVCKRAISLKKQIAHRHKCQVAHCYKYYHIECLEHWPQTQYTTVEKKGKEFVESLQCPRHVCHTCVCDDPRGCKTRFSGDKLARCVRCPATYHTFTKCLPAGTQILSGSHIICPRHYEHRPGKVPCHVNTGWCFICALGGTLICCEYCPTSFHAECLNIEPPEGGYMCEDCETGCLPLYGEMVWVKLGHYRWWPGLILHPSEIPENILAVKHAPGEFVVRFFGQYDHYWVNRGRVFPFQEGDTGRVSSKNSKIDAAFSMAVEHAHRAYKILKNESPSNEGDEDIASSLLPPHYVKLKVNKPCGSLINKKIDIEESSLTQCECDPNVEDPCGLYSHCLNRMLLTECGPICRAGERCCNRAFEKRQYPKMEPYRTPARGWGLRTLEDIRAGQFVIEYVGELIDEVEFQRRMKWKHQVRDENYYFLTLDKERMIDAGPKGNLARFMNHSCDPNCETQKWTVLGDVRVGLFALYDIPAKSELTFNYNLECAGIEKKRCLCGAARCSGFMGAKPKQEEPKKNKVKRTYKKRKRIELSPTNEQPKPKRRQPKNRELTEIEKDLLIIKNATNGISSDSESSGRQNSIDSVKRKRNVNSPSTKRVKVEKKRNDKPDQTLASQQCERIVVNHKSFDVD